jgi:hypothetical protein
MATSMPITLAMTFGIWLHRIAASLDRHPDHRAGLLVDNPVVANDAIGHQLAPDILRLLPVWTTTPRAIIMRR